MPSKDILRAVQQEDRKAGGAMIAASISLTTPVGKAWLDEEILFRIKVDDKPVLWIHSQDKSLQVRLMVCGHMNEARHRGVAATLQRLKEYCFWSRMDAQVNELVRQCLH